MKKGVTAGLSRKRGGDAKWLSNHSPLCSPAPWWKGPRQAAHTHSHWTHMHVSSTLDVGNTARETLSLRSDLATHYVALWWHHVAAVRPKGCRNVFFFLPSMQSCQSQQFIKSASRFAAPDTRNNDGFTAATTRSRVFSFNERLSKNNDSHFASIRSVARMRGTLKSDLVKQKTVQSQNKAGECRVHSGTAM